MYFTPKLNIPDVSHLNPVVVDLFCGVGGLTNGLQAEDLRVVAGVDFDDTCRYSFEHNNNATFLHRDITTVTPEEINALYPEHSLKILVGCAPCQPFSKIRGERNEEDGKWKLLYSFSKLIEAVQPDLVSMENVSQLVSYNKGEVLNDFIAKLEALNYTVNTYRVNAMHYGAPQRRNRLILFASKYGPVKLIPKTHKKGNYTSVKDAIGYLPPIEDGETDKKDPLHRARKLSPLNKQRIQATSEGGDWSEWPEELTASLECRKTETGRTFMSAYGRMTWKDPSPTLTTYCTGLSNGRHGHPEQDRAISLREAALLQTFPADYSFLEEGKFMSLASLSRHIGNAVPPVLGQVIAKSIKQHLHHYSNGRWSTQPSLTLS